MKITRRRALTSVVALTIALSGCSSSPPSPGEPQSAADTIPHDAETGQTLDEARASIEAISGIAVTEFTGGGRPNVKGNTGYTVALTIEPGYVVDYGDLLVDFVVWSVWSVGEGYMPNTQIEIRTSTGDGEPYFDLSASGAGAGWTYGPVRESAQHTTLVVPLSEDSPEGALNLKRLAREGNWPGAVPDALPDDVTRTVGHDG